MRRLLATLAVGGMLSSTAGCTSVNGVPDLFGIPISQVIADTELACSYVPDASAVLNIIFSATPGLSTANAVATAICQAVANPPAPLVPTPASVRRALMRASVPMVNGIVVTGHFR